MKKSAYVHCALISAALASCNRPLYQQTAPESATRYIPDDTSPAGIPDPSPGDTLSWLSGRDLQDSESCWYYAFRDIELNWQGYTGMSIYQPPYRGKWFRMPFAHILRSGFGRPTFHAGA